MTHIPVLLQAVVDNLLSAGGAPDRFIDGTLGAGGHTLALLENGAGSVLGLDLDINALETARHILREYPDRVHFAQSNYTQMAVEAARLGWKTVDGIVLDLGLSSLQLEDAARGFAFKHDGPLDMRFDPGGSRPPASEIINYYDETELAALFLRYGEEPLSRPFARSICASRPLSSTRQLAEIIEKEAAKFRRGPKETIHPATRIFQALRIAVNDELTSVEGAIPTAVKLLSPGGRLAIISFHSLEDRIVKQAFKEMADSFTPPPGMASMGTKQAQVRLITRKPILPTEAEIAANPRSRSAKLRVIEKL